MNLNYVRMGRIIKSIRKSKGLSQAELAESADLSVPYISHIETGRSKASLETVVNIANILNVTVDRLLCGNLECADYSDEFRELFSDCSSYEKSVILETASHIKISLRKNRDLLIKKRN